MPPENLLPRMLKVERHKNECVIMVMRSNIIVGHPTHLIVTRSVVVGLALGFESHSGGLQSTTSRCSLSYQMTELHTTPLQSHCFQIIPDIKRNLLPLCCAARPCHHHLWQQGSHFRLPWSATARFVKAPQRCNPPTMGCSCNCLRISDSPSGAWAYFQTLFSTRSSWWAYF